MRKNYEIEIPQLKKRTCPLTLTVRMQNTLNVFTKEEKNENLYLYFSTSDHIGINIIYI